ncbi:single-stranded DNA-binding protein [Brachybacterium tyrofermentans]|uniref:single-stranded DNA-binding protein n=1 Tax=Brachybacterium tyrofermentans TaxID=47848 RepID=UPI0018662B71|nr:single-stranded DNA-binding protein [Brachybacterium tyrofermentans]
MANDTIITVIGNLTADPELRFTQSGIAVANFTIASTPRSFDRQANEWKDDEAMFLRSTIWRDAAENVAESLQKGSRVIAQGRLVQRSYQDREGNARTSIELQVDEIGPSVKYATAQPNKVDRRNGQNGGGNGGWSGSAQSTPQAGNAPANDPWAGGGSGGGYDDPPF